MEDSIRADAWATQVLATSQLGQREKNLGIHICVCIYLFICIMFKTFLENWQRNMYLHMMYWTELQTLHRCDATITNPRFHHRTPQRLAGHNTKKRLSSFPSKAMADALAALLVATFTAGMIVGAVGALLCKWLSNSQQQKPCEKKLQCQVPSHIWLSRAGRQFHLEELCPSLKVDGSQRLGVSHFRACSHCVKEHSSKEHQR